MLFVSNVSILLHLIALLIKYRTLFGVVCKIKSCMHSTYFRIRIIAGSNQQFSYVFSTLKFCFHVWRTHKHTQIHIYGENCTCVWLAMKATTSKKLFKNLQINDISKWFACKHAIWFREQNGVNTKSMKFSFFFFQNPVYSNSIEWLKATLNTQE